MNYDLFVAAVEAYPLFGTDVLSTLKGSSAGWQLQLTRWAKQGKVLRLKRGLYTLPASRRKGPLSLRWLANTLYSPSYLSLEYVLSWHDLIPERVSAITSVTPRKTQTFENPLGHFVYQTLKQELFFGFEEREDEHQTRILMATPEKALLDYIYLYPRWKSTSEFAEQNIRLQNMDSLNKKLLKKYAKKFCSPKITRAVEVLL